MKNKLWLVLVVLLVAALFVVPVAAKTGVPPPAPTPAPSVCNPATDPACTPGTSSDVIPVCDPATDPSCVVVVQPSPPAATDPTLPDIAILVVIVAFFKKRFNLQDDGVIVAVIIVGSVLWFVPLLSDKLPGAKYWIDSAMLFIKWILGSMGTVDFAINTGAKIMTTTKADLEVAAK